MTDPTQSALNAATTTAPAGFQRVVVGVDFSESASHALDTARARFPGATLRLVHVTDARVTATPDLMGGVSAAMPDPTLLQTLEDADATRMQGVVREGEETELMVGDPVTGLLEAAASWGADLIVVGTHARGAIEHFFLGSTAEKVVARSPIPVLTVRGGNRPA
ncbi:universal stress protein [Deinococcus seoulensis]|nr:MULTISPECIES: universal stress protein [Deinococcus]GGR75455.1 universal stress protein [Deinococcus seoulensis]